MFSLLSFPTSPHSTFVSMTFLSQPTKDSTYINQTSCSAAIETLKLPEQEAQDITSLKIFDTWENSRKMRIRYSYEYKATDKLPPLKPIFATCVIEASLIDPLEKSPYNGINERAFNAFSVLLRETRAPSPRQIPKSTSFDEWELIQIVEKKTIQ